MTVKRIGILIMLVATTAASGASALSVSTTDVVPDAERDHFNGFEALEGVSRIPSPYVEDNIKIQQISNAEGFVAEDFVDVAFTDVSSNFLNFEGNFAWASRGLTDYTRISLADGGSMDALGLLIGSRWDPDAVPITILWSAVLDGLEVAGGKILRTQGDFEYFGFSGGTFDALLLRDAPIDPTSVSLFDGTTNAIAIDSIEVSTTPIPLPTAGWMLLSAVGGLAVARRYGKRA